MEVDVSAGRISTNLAIGRRRMVVLVWSCLARAKVIVGGGWPVGDCFSVHINCTHQVVITIEGPNDFAHNPMVASSVMITRSPTFRLGLVAFHLPVFWRYSPDQRLQKWWMTAWQSVHLLCSDGSELISVSGYARRARLIRKCLI